MVNIINEHKLINKGMFLGFGRKRNQSREAALLIVFFNGIPHTTEPNVLTFGTFIQQCFCNSYNYLTIFF